jgi:hypothetical protein
MKIAAIIQAHNDDDVVLDTIDSVKRWMTTDILTVMDGVSWDGVDKDKFSSSYLVQGLNHGLPNNPYRNVFFGLKQVYDKWPDKDWYCYLEYDCLVTSNSFESDLKKAEKSNYWLLGTDLRMKKCKFPFIEKIIDKKFNETFYVLGCFYFLHRNYIAALNDLNFFDKFLSLTNHFSNGFFPMFSGRADCFTGHRDGSQNMVNTFGPIFDLSEELIPTLAYYLGGKIGSLSFWGDGCTHPHNVVAGANAMPTTSQQSESGRGNSLGWYGNYRKYPVRWRPDLNGDENFIEAAIMHPLKTYDHPIRQYHRQRRDSALVTACSEHVDAKIYPSLIDINWFNQNGVFNVNVKDEIGRLWNIMSADGKGVTGVSMSGPFDFSF